MSVSLFSGAQAAKIAESFKDETTQRSIWYAYISNVTAYNLQYNENQPIQFNAWESSEESFTDMNEAIRALGSLLYNAYTNAGNYFCPLHDLESLKQLVSDHEATEDYREYRYQIER